MSDEYVSDDGPSSDLCDPYETGWWKSIANDKSVTAVQPYPNYNREGQVVIRVYPWDDCSYDEKPCELCNPASYRLNLED